MDLKKLSELEAEARSRLDIAPHEQDDPDVAVDPFASLAQSRTNAILSPLHNQILPVGGGVSIGPTHPQYATQYQTVLGQPGRVTIEGAEPKVVADGDELLIVMHGGREMAFMNTRTSAPININGQERTFRLTKEQAKELAIKLVRMSVSEQ